MLLSLWLQRPAERISPGSPMQRTWRPWRARWVKACVRSCHSPMYFILATRWFAVKNHASHPANPSGTSSASMRLTTSCKSAVLPTISMPGV